MFLGVFLVAEKKKYEKRKKKKKVQLKLIWATSQTMSRYNGKLYRDMALWVCRLARGGLCRNTPNCIVTEMKAGYWGDYVTI